MWATLRFRLGVVRQNKAAFARWVWLKLRRKTGYRFAPFYKTEIDSSFTPLGGAPEIRQANGWVLPVRSKPDTDPITIRADIEAAWDAVCAAEAKQRKKRRK